MEKKHLQIGALAPDFVLKDQDGKEIALNALRGKKVVLSFHPLAWTGVCATQMQQLDANQATLEAHNAIGLGVSIDSRQAKKPWAEQLGIQRTSLLADFWPHGAVAEAFGILREADGFSERAVFIVDPEGKIAWKKVYPIGELPDINESLAAIAAI